MQRQVDLDQHGADVVLGVQRINAQFALDTCRAVIRKRHSAPVFRDDVVLLFPQAGDHVGDVTGGLRTGTVAGQDEGDQGFVNQHGVRLIHQRHVRRRLHRLNAGGDLVITQHVKAQLVDGGVNDVRAVGLAALLRGQLLRHGGHGQAEELHQGAHPLGVARCQIVVDRHHVHALSGEREPRGSHGAHQGLALTRRHLDHVALQQAQDRL